MSYTTKALNNTFCGTLHGDYARISWLRNQAFLLWHTSFKLHVSRLHLLTSYSQNTDWLWLGKCIVTTFTCSRRV